MEREFQFPSGEFQLWVPLEPTLAVVPEQARNRALRIFRAVGRLRAGVALAEAQAEVDAVAARLSREHPETSGDVGFRFIPIHERLVGDMRTALVVLMGVVAVVLAIACVNLANLLLVRARSREREVAVRAALGAGRGRLLRQHVTESLVLTLAGSALGLLVATGILSVLPVLAPFEIPRSASIRIDLLVLAFTAAVALVTGLLLGLVPAWQASRMELTSALRDGAHGTAGRGGRRLRAGLTSAEVALALVLVVGAGLLVQSLARLLRVEAGFVPENLLTFNVVFVEGGAARPPEQRAALARDILERLQALPGVGVAGAGSGLPPDTPQRGTGFAVDGKETRPADSRAYFLAVSPDYFKALRTPMVEGRPFGDGDAAGAPEVVILGQSLARRLFGTEPAVGKRIRLVNPEHGSGWRTVVGVAGDVLYAGLGEQPGNAIYTPFAQTPFLWMYGVVRTPGPPEVLGRAVRQAVASVDPSLDVAALRSMEHLLAESVAQPRWNVLLLSAFAGLALALAAVGVYGVISYSASQRVREIGIRVALGASRSEVVRLVTAEGLRLTAAGIAMGLLAAAAATRLLSALLFEMQPLDLPTFAGSAVLIAAVALAASLLPAARASRIDPSVALRSE
jgi:putative ABC transport system permease protein